MINVIHNFTVFIITVNRKKIFFLTDSEYHKKTGGELSIVFIQMLNIEEHIEYYIRIQRSAESKQSNIANN